MNEKRLRGETVFEGRVFSIEVDEVELENGLRGRREVVRHPGGVGILAVDRQNRVVLVRQFRYAAGRELLEIPAGRLEPGEDPMEAGIRELREETGFSAGKVTDLGYIIPTGGYCSEKIYLFLAEELAPGDTCPDDGEFVEPVMMPMDELKDAIKRGEIIDAKTIAAVYKYSLM